jgi:hypothetical protein
MPSIQLAAQVLDHFLLVSQPHSSHYLGSKSFTLYASHGQSISQLLWQPTDTLSDYRLHPRW